MLLRFTFWYTSIDASALTLLILGILLLYIFIYFWYRWGTQRLQPYRRRSLRHSHFLIFDKEIGRNGEISPHMLPLISFLLFLSFWSLPRCIAASLPDSFLFPDSHGITSSELLYYSFHFHYFRFSIWCLIRASLPATRRQQAAKHAWAYFTQ